MSKKMVVVGHFRLSIKEGCEVSTFKAQRQLQQKKQKRSIYRFFLEVLAWLIICFISWFLLAKILNIPLIWLSEWFFGWITGDVVNDVSMHGGATYGVINQQFVIHTNIPPPDEHPVFTVARPLIYGYGLAVFAAMTLATPKDEGRKWAEIGVAYIVFLFVQLFGMMNKMYMDLVFFAPESISQYFPWVEGRIDLLVASYQISTLVLPPVMPLILWILFNVSYMETLIGYKMTKSPADKK